MPVNSFDDYYMSWRPDKDKLEYPLQESLANYLEDDIKNGNLKEHVKLPPQRELADFLDLSLATVTRAYKICEKKGLIYGVVGKGTFVSPNINSPRSVVEKNLGDDIIEMGITIPFHKHEREIADLTKQIVNEPTSYKYFEYKNLINTKESIKVARNWLKSFGVDAKEDCISITSGSQNALAIIIMSLFKSGDKIATDNYTYANFIGLANLLDITLVGIGEDGDGMSVEMLENACKMNTIKGVFLMPSCNNPTSRVMSFKKRKKIAQVIKDNDMILIEDGTYSFLPEEKIPPIVSIIPENTIYVNSISKPICSVIRIGYMSYDEKFKEKIEQGICDTNLMNSGLNVEIATRILRDGLYEKIVNEKKQMAEVRNEIFDEYFGDISEKITKYSYYRWLPVPQGFTGDDIERMAKQRGVQVYCSERFSVGNIDNKYSIRVSICTPKDEEELRKGLSIIKELYKEIESI